MDNVEIRGRKGSLHFIRFPTAEMGNFLALAKSKGMAQLVTTVCATGGGAFKFEENFEKVITAIFSIFLWFLIQICLIFQEVNMKLAKFDELDALIKGILFSETHSRTECYYWENASDIRWALDRIIRNRQSKISSFSFQFKSKSTLWFFSAVPVHLGQCGFRCVSVGCTWPRQLQKNIGYKVGVNIRYEIGNLTNFFWKLAVWAAEHSSVCVVYWPAAIRLKKPSNWRQKAITQRWTS